MIDAKNIAEQYDKLFGEVLIPQEIFKYDPGFLADTIISMMPVHVGLTIDNIGDVDTLLALYPYLYQKIATLHAHMVHEVRKCNGKGMTEQVGKARDHRDVLEEMLKVVKLQYESVSRRITLRIESRG